MLSMQNSWTETSELGPVHPETTESGWGHASEIEGPYKYSTYSL
jgi:hypothetical protein